MLDFIQSHHLQNYIYLIIFFGMFADAAITVFAAVFLISSGTIVAGLALPILLFGIYAEQLVYYYIGAKLSNHAGVSRWADKLARPFDRHLLSRTFHTLLISKFVYGLHRAILIRSGMLKINFKMFAKSAVFISMIWLAVIAGLGFSFSASYEALKKYFHYAELVPLILIGLFFFVEWLLSKRLKKEI
jgi:membrane protein DedA with SNARE-associated domain